MYVLSFSLIVAWFIIFMVTELRMASRGCDTWQWIQRLYNSSSVLQRIKW